MLRYILVTNYDGHWDGFDGIECAYPLDMLYRGMRPPKFVDGTDTLFVKLTRTESSKPEKAWKGEVTDIRTVGKTVFFTPRIKEEIPARPEYWKYKIGWYAEEVQNNRKPRFFEEATKTGDYSLFEDSVFMILRSLGIHSIWRYPPTAQADGFFQVKSLVVLYHATLDYNELRHNQTANYARSLASGHVPGKYGNHALPITCTKRVWIITKAPASREIGKVLDVPIIEVAIDDLQKIYSERLTSDTDEEYLEGHLRDLGQC